MYDLHDLYDTSDKHDVQDIVALSIGYIVHWESINLLKCASYDFISKLPSRYQCSGTMADPPPFHSTATGSKPAATRSGALKIRCPAIPPISVSCSRSRLFQFAELCGSARCRAFMAFTKPENLRARVHSGTP